jgi:DNA (cytosine-5)-methyltransferase 1
MSWLYSQALVEEYLGANFLDGERSALLSGNPTQQAYCAPDKMTVFSRLSRFGMTFKLLTENRGEELLTLYLEDSRAKTSQSQEKEPELPESAAECGNTWQGLLAKYNPSTSSWKTPQCSLFEDLEQSLETFPRWGSMRNGELYQRQQWEPPISETESGSLQKTPNNETFFHTPLTTGMDGGSNSRRALKKRQALWLTPSTVDIPTRSAESMEKRLEYRKKIGRNGAGPGCLSEQVEWSQDGPPIGYMTRDKFPTPLASDWKPRSPNSKQQGLAEVVKILKKKQEMWPTPRSCSAMAATITPEAAWNENRNPNLETIVGQRMWGTPKAQDSRHALRDRGKGNLGEQVSGLHNGGKLNPTWVEWLMGWPLGWTDLKPLEMDKCHCVQQQLGKC